MVVALKDGPSSSGREVVDRSASKAVPRLVSPIPDESMLNTSSRELETSQVTALDGQQSGAQESIDEGDEGGGGFLAKYGTSILAGLQGGIAYNLITSSIGYFSRGQTGLGIAMAGLGGAMAALAVGNFMDDGSSETEEAPEET